MVDNASSDGSAKFVKENYPKVTVISNDRNIGFAAANNKAIKRSNSKYIILMNSDCRVFKRSLDNLVEFMEKNPRVGVAQGMISLHETNVLATIENMSWLIDFRDRAKLSSEDLECLGEGASIFKQENLRYAVSKINPLYDKFNPQPSVNVFRLEDGKYQFYGWMTDPETFDTLEELLAHIERYFKAVG